MKRMKKAISLLAAAVMVFALAVPVNASTDTGVPDTSAAVVTKVSDATELATAIAAGGNIQLTANIKLESGLSVASDKTVVLDLNGFTISHEKAQTTAYAMIANKGDLTITDSSEKQTGVIRYADITSYTADNNHASNTIKNEGVLTIKGGTIENVSSDNVADHGYPHAIDVYQGSTTNISGGTVKSVNYDSIRMFCNSTTEATTLNITSGTIINRISFQVPSAKAANGVLNISGGTFITTDEVSANVRLLAFGTDLSNMKATISGGTFDKGVKISNYSGGEITWTPVTGGTFASDVSAYVAEGYECQEQSDSSTYAVGVPLKNIIDNAADGSTVKLDRDYTVNETIYINKNLTIDGNGHKITADVQKPFRINEDADDSASVKETIKVTFQNISMTSDVSEGRLIETRGGYVDLTLDGVTLTTTGANSQPYTAGGKHADPISVTIKNSTLDAGDSGYCIIVFNPVKLVVEKSTLSGYSTLYFKGESSSAGSAGTVADIIGGTISQGKGVANEGFGVAVFEDDNVTLNIKDSTINATGVETSAYKAFSFSWLNYSSAEEPKNAVKNNVVTITGNSVINILGTNATIEGCVDETVTSNTVIFAGGKCNVDPSDYLKTGYGIYEDTEGMYVVCNHANTTVTDDAKAALCEATGLTEGSHCDACKTVIVKQEEVTATGHSYKGEVTTEPTCIATGVKTFTCENGCGSTYTEELAIVGHAYSTEFTVDKEATCTDAGSKSRHCTVSGCTEKIEVTEIAATGHTYKGEVTTEPTCIAKGVEIFTCENGCGSTYTEELATVGHAYSTEFTVDKEATCTEPGSKSKHCTVSGCNEKTDVTEITAHGHAYDDGVITTPATCIKEGVKTFTCTTAGCETTYTEDVAVVDHEYATEFTVDQEATCTDPGSKSKHCTVSGCTEKIEVIEIAATGHTYKGEVTTEPTCIATGVKTFTCENGCGSTYTEELATVGHAYSTEFTVDKEATCTDPGSKSKHCTVSGCTEKIEVTEIVAHGHAYDDGVITTPATCIKEGVKTFTCTTVDCGTTKTETVAKADHIFADTYTVDKASTCTVKGIESKHCTQEGCTAKSSERELALVDHKYSAYEYDNNATCTEDGTETATCDFGCGAKSTLPVEDTALGHTEVADEAVAPTCQKTGLTAGSHCSVCGDAIVAQKEVAVVDHKYSTYKYDDNATCTEDGTETATCDFGCGAKSILPAEGTALGHSYDKGVCTACGSIIEVIGDTTEVVTKGEVTTDKNDEVVVKEVTIIEDKNTTEAKESVKAEANTIVATVVTEAIVAETPVEELQIVQDGVISAETAEKLVEAIEAGETEFVTEIVVTEAKAETVEKAVQKGIEKKAVATLGENAQVAQYLDVSVLLKAASTDETLGTLDKLEKEIVVTIAVPENLKADGRTYIVIREHNGVIEKIPTVKNADGTISFKTGKFSTYALAYTDDGVSAPKTGDFPMAAPIAIVCVAGIAAALTMTKRRTIAR